ncbi:MAG: sigma-70 family RNA polymerase sigma factor [Bryobacterales bacterium]|nr:sigma-70 family RNA polymerase sigma factor [Bryobacterales bacterium]
MNPAQSWRVEFESVALPHMGDLFRTAVAMTGNRTDAEDLVQETYLEAWKSFHRFETGTNCRAWMFRILIHRIHHYRRRWHLWGSKTQTDDLLMDNLRHEDPIPEDVSDEDMLLALSRLPEMFREIVLLADVQEFTYKEIASMLGVPIGTVMSRLSRGRGHLREQLLAITGQPRPDPDAQTRPDAGGT